MTGSGRTPIYGPEPLRTKRDAVWSYWDLWFCVVAVADHDGDLDALVAAIEDRDGSFLSGTVEAKLSHLDDLRLRLTEARLDAEALAGRCRGRSGCARQGAQQGPQAGPVPPRSDRRDAPPSARRVCMSGHCVAAGSCSRSRPSRSTNGWRMGSARQTGRRARRVRSRAESRPRASGLTATPPLTPRRGSPPDARCSRSATGRCSAAMTPTV